MRSPHGAADGHTDVLRRYLLINSDECGDAFIVMKLPESCSSRYGLSRLCWGRRFCSWIGTKRSGQVPPRPRDGIALVQVEVEDGDRRMLLFPGAEAVVVPLR